MTPKCSFSLKTKIPSLSEKITTPKTIGDFIKNKRLDKKLKQGDVAKLFGIASSYLSFLELNRKPIHPKSLEAVISFLEFVPKLSSTFERLGTRTKLWRIQHNVSVNKFSELTHIPVEIIEKIETARYCKIDKKVTLQLEQFLGKKIT